ncbi:MAG: polymorphic toxin type 28 domain-containing protein [Anaerolineales bacterium]|nr:polymorphic toxin type 28 domain-containing protein [Anaerolineales bacterium]
MADALGLGEEYDDLITDPAFVAGQRGGRLIGLIESLGLGAISGGVRTTIPTVQLVRPGAALGGSGALVLSDAVALVIEGKVVIVTPEALAALGAVLQFAKRASRGGEDGERTDRHIDENLLREGKLAGYERHLTPEDLEAARDELEGIKIVGPKGVPFEHLVEVRQAQRGLREYIRRLENRIRFLSTTDPHDLYISRLQAKLGEAKDLLSRSEKYVPPGR